MLNVSVVLLLSSTARVQVGPLEKEMMLNVLMNMHGTCCLEEKRHFSDSDLTATKCTHLILWLKMCAQSPRNWSQRGVVCDFLEGQHIRRFDVLLTSHP